MRWKREEPSAGAAVVSQAEATSSDVVTKHTGSTVLLTIELAAVALSDSLSWWKVTKSKPNNIDC